MVSAFAARQRIVLGQIKVADKADEIVAIPRLLEMLEIEGAIITIDVMGWQRTIAQQIIDQKADYVLALKGNQNTLHSDVMLFVEEQKARSFGDSKSSRHESIDGDHGRIETRTTKVLHNIAWLQERHAWPGLKTVVIVESTREIASRREHETRLYISSSDLPADQPGPIVQSHWAIENSLHRVPDMVFAMTNVGSEQTMLAPVSPPSGTSPPISCDCLMTNTRSVPAGRSRHGTMSFSPALFHADTFTRYP